MASDYPNDPADLLDWLLSCYFDGWEIEQAERLRKSQGHDAAVESLRKRAVDSWRGYHRAYGGRGYDTVCGKVRVFEAGHTGHEAPDFVITCERLAKMKLAQAAQPSLFSQITEGREP